METGLEKVKEFEVERKDYQNNLSNLEREQKRHKQYTERRFTDIESLTRAILFIAALTMVGIAVSIGSLVFDQVRFNYEQTNQRSLESAKIEVITEELRVQRELIEQNNKSSTP